MSIPLAVTGIGAVSAVGRTAAATAAAIRAGFSAPHPVRAFRLPSFPSGDMAPITGYPIRGMTEGFGPFGRCVHLSVRSVREALRAAGLAGRDDPAEWARTGLYWALPAPDPGRFVELEAIGPQVLGGVLGNLRRALGVPIAEARAELVLAGHAGAAAALVAARDRLASGEIDRAIVVAADSHLDARTLAWLHERGRLGSQETTAGLIPGEAGAAVLVETPVNARRDRRSVHALIPSAAADLEPNHLYSGKVSTGAALTRTLRGTLPRPLDGDVIVDLNGEEWRAREWGLARARVGQLLGRAGPPLLPARSLGDTGSASGLIGLVCAAASLARGYARGKEALIVSSSDHGHVGAFVVRPPERAS